MERREGGGAASSYGGARGSQPRTFDRIGVGYAAARKPEPLWRARVDDAVAGHRPLVNIGAGSGSYEPAGPRVFAVEPSWTMLLQRPVSAPSVVRAVAERLPFADDAFEASLAVLTLHHWTDPGAGLAEMRRVSRRQIVITWDSEKLARFWLLRDYLPELVERERSLATLAVALEHLPGATSEVLPVPAECADGFLGAYWKRPELFLEDARRRAISGLALLDPRVVAAAMGRLESDLRAGRWRRRHQELAHLNEIDLGYRLVVAER